MVGPQEARVKPVNNVNPVNKLPLTRSGRGNGQADWESRSATTRAGRGTVGTGLRGILLIALLCACGDDDGPTDPDPTPAPSRIPSAIRTLEANSMRLKMRSDGGGYDEDQISTLNYRDVSAIFDLGLWVGAKVGGEVRVSATSYNGSEFDAIELAPGGDSSQVYLLLPGDHAGIPDYDQWPIEHGAPKTTGELPRLLGDATMFAVFDDENPAIHERFGSAPLHAQVRQTSWGFSEPDSVLFVRYEVGNLSPEPWTDAYLGVWADIDLGHAANDRNACDLPRQLGITFTSPLTAERETLFGSAQPALGIRLLSTPDNAGLFAFPLIQKSITEPSDAMEAYNLLQGLNIDGEAFFDSTAQATTRYVLTGDPISEQGWIETYSSDKRMLLSTGPLVVDPGEFVSLTIGIVLARAREPFDALTAVRAASDGMAEARDRWDLH